MDALINRVSQESGLIVIVGIAMALVAVPVVLWRIRSGHGLLSAVWKTGLEAAILGSLAGVLALTLGSFATGGQGQFNLLPFRSLFESVALGAFWVEIVLVDLAANVLLYVPAGLFVAFRFQRLSIWAWALVVVASTGAIEIVQGFVLNRAADISDVLMNGLGGVTGFVIARVIQRLVDGPRRDACTSI